MPFDPISYAKALKATKQKTEWNEIRNNILNDEELKNAILTSITYNEIRDNILNDEELKNAIFPQMFRREIVNYGLQIMALKAMTNAVTKDYYAVVADYNWYKGTYRMVIGSFDNDGGGVWKASIKIPIATIPAEHAQYKVVINRENVEVYNALGTLKISGSISGFWNLVKSDGSDIRVFRDNGAQIYFWIESWDYTNQQATIWVKVEAGSSELNIAYGNPSATKSTYENGDMVFEFFDDFLGTSLDTTKWQVVRSSDVLYVSDSNLTIGSESRPCGLVASKNPVPINTLLEYRFKVIEVRGLGMRSGFKHNTTISYSNAFFFVEDTGSDLFEKTEGTTKTTLISNLALKYGNYHVVGINIINSKVRAFKDGDKLGEWTHSLTYPEYYIWFGEPATASGDYTDISIDWVRVLKLADPADFSQPTYYGLYETDNFSFPDGIDQVLITVDGDISQIEYSTDGGTTWNVIQPDTETLLPTTAYQIKFKFTGGLKGYAFLVW